MSESVYDYIDRQSDWSKIQKLATKGLVSVYDYGIKPFLPRKYTGNPAVASPPDKHLNSVYMPPRRRNRNPIAPLRRNVTVRKKVARIARANKPQPRRFRGRRPVMRGRAFRSQMSGIKSLPLAGVGRFRTSVRAPVSIGNSTRGGVAYNIMPSRRPGCMKVHVRYHVGQVGAYGIVASPQYQTSMTIPGLGECGGQFYVDPSSDCYTSQMVSKQVQNYQRYRVNTQRLHYVSAVGTGTPGNLLMCYFNDVTYFETISSHYTSSTVSVQASDLFDSPYMCDTPVWQSKVTQWMRGYGDASFKFVAGVNDTSTAPYSYSIEAATNRQNYAGVWGLAPVNVTPPANTTFTYYGDIWWEGIIECCDFRSVKMQLTGAPGPLTPEERKASRDVVLEMRRMALSEKKEKELDLQTDDMVHAVVKIASQSKKSSSVK